MENIIEKLVPQLRFGEFVGEWEKKKISEVLTIGSGKDYKHLETGNIPVFGTGGYMLSVNKSLHTGKTVFIGRKGTIDKPFYFDGSFWTVDTLFYTHSFRETTPKFIYFTFLKINWKLHNEASGVPSLSKKTINSINVNFPQLPEQKKIATFLSAIDKKIQQLSRKKALLEEYKKGVMQQLFSGDLRFKDENGEEFGEWEVIFMNVVFERIKEKNKENNQNVLTISAQNGLINQMDYFNRSIASKDVTGYYLLQKGDFAYNKSYSKGYPMGAIKRLDLYKKGIVSPLYICFRLKKDNDSDFYKEFLDFGGINKGLHKIAQEGARNHGLLNMSVIEFFRDIEIIRPTLEEQKRISIFLKKLTQRINQATKELKKAKTFKKGLLQQLFV